MHAFKNSFTVSLVAALSVVDTTLLQIQNLYYQSNKNWIFRQKQRDVCRSKYCALISIMKGKDVKQFLLRSRRCAVVKARHTYANVTI